MIRHHLLAVFGVIGGYTVAGWLCWTLTYPLLHVSMPLFIIKDVVTTALITGVLTWWFFKETGVAPSPKRGLELSASLVIVGLVLGLALSLSYQTANADARFVAMPGWYTGWFQFILFGVQLLAPPAVGRWLQIRQ